MVNIGFTGDFCPWKRVEELYQIGDAINLFRDVESFFKENDLNVIDLEGPLTNAKKGIQKTGPHLKADPSTASLLKRLNCDLVATANNHFKDFGWVGMSETYRALAEVNVEYIGSGKDQKQASEAYSFEQEGLKIAIYNICENEWSTAEKETPGCNGLDPVKDFRKINELNLNHDFVIVVMHGGHEHYPLPSPRMQELYRFFVECGASSVIGHHTHVISGYEIYHGAPIFYSLGNFCFDWGGEHHDAWNKGMLVKLKLEKNQLPHFEYKFIHHMGEEALVRFVYQDEKILLENEIDRLNRIIQNNVELEKSFENYAENLRPIICTRLQPYQGKWLPSLYKKGFLPKIFNKKKETLLTNLIQCESHYDLLTYTLRKNIQD